MNKPAFFLLFFLIFLELSAFVPNNSEVTTQESISLELTLAKDMCISQNTHITTDLLEILDFADDHLNYWRLAQSQPYTYFLSKGPIKWLYGSSQEKELKEHIKALEQCQSWAAKQLGQIADISYKLQQAPSDKEIKPLLFTSIHFAKNYLVQTKQSTDEQTVTIKELTGLLANNVEELTLTKNEIFSYLQRHKKPNHFVRNWLYYSTLAAIAALSSNYVYNNPEKPFEWAEKAKNGLELFVRNHIMSPIKKIYTLIFSQIHETESTSLALHSDDEIKKLEHCILHDAREYLQKYHSLSGSELESEAHKAVSGTCEKLIRDFKIKLGTKPIVGAYDGKLGIGDIQLAIDYLSNNRDGAGERFAEMTKIKIGTDEQMSDLIAIWGLRYDLMIKAILSNISKIFQANKLNFELLMIIPAALTMYGSYKTTNYLAHLCIPKYTFYKPVKTILRSIGQLLNRYNSPSMNMGPEQEGTLLFLTYKLKKYVTCMPHEIQGYFSEDIQELACPELLVYQKLEIWNRMYKTYDFLSPVQVKGPKEY